jgi:hypothetical protein
VANAAATGEPEPLAGTESLSLPWLLAAKLPWLLAAKLPWLLAAAGYRLLAAPLLRTPTRRPGQR